jgi:ABC-type transport system involved in cytochrome bd biosynthesis fused ATPase/permease subunit
VKWLTKVIKGFGMFWWDFLVGDTPEIFVAVLVIIGAIALLSVNGHFNAAAATLLPVLAVLALGASVWRAARSMRK